MKKLQVIFFALCIFCFVGCSEESPSPDPNPTPNTNLDILPIGDSRVQGLRPEFESYRFELWKNLLNANYTFDLVGNRFDDASYPDFNGQSFDRDHGGIGGDRTQDVLDRMPPLLNALNGPLEVVLLGIGGNDLLGGIPISTIMSNMNLIIDQFQAHSPDVTIFVEQIAPGRSDINTPELLSSFTEMNSQIAPLATTASTDRSSIIVVDMFTGWGDQYMADDVHYNEAGAKLVADRYFAAIQANISN
ncbi:MAG: GDSL-type esterase/lipase family protein [Bacteroidota bacterium]